MFKRRAGKSDAGSEEAAMRVVRDIMPPIVYRNMMRVRRKLGV